MNKYLCLVCGFNELNEPPYGPNQEPSYEICPCCGFEFGFDESQTSMPKYRQMWIDDGTPWFDRNLKPENWNYQKQLENLPDPSA